MTKETDFRDECRKHLNERWETISQTFEEGTPVDPLDDSETEAKTIIKDSLICGIKTYHYVLPTQLLFKCLDPKLDARSLQESFDSPGAYDARTLAHDVIVPFDKANNNVLGGSPEPYVNNPLRIPGITATYRNQQKDKTTWDRLVTLLKLVEEEGQDFACKAFDQVLYEIYRLLAGVTVVYPVPSRISLKRTIELVKTYLSVKSGGERYEAVCTALFRTIGKHFEIYSDVKRMKVNAADASSGMVADIECYCDDEIVLLVEAKDRTLTLTQLDSKVYSARSSGITELLFMAEKGKEKGEATAIEERIASEFVSGQNVYVSNFSDFSAGILLLLGEKGRAEFLREVGAELDKSNAPIQHRKGWAEELKKA